MNDSERYTGDDTFLPPDQKSPPGPLDGDETFVAPQTDENPDETVDDPA